MSWFRMALQNYVVFSGRSRRAEFWWFNLVFVIVYCALSLVDVVTGTFDADNGIGLTSGIFLLAMLPPALSVSVRRMHDIDRTGWWVLLSLIPLLGGAVIMLFAMIDGTRGGNRYGADPKALPA